MSANQDNKNLVVDSDVEMASESEYEEEIDQYAGANNDFDLLPADEDEFAEIDSENIVDGKTRALKLAFGEQPEDDDDEQDDPTFELPAQLSAVPTF